MSERVTATESGPEALARAYYALADARDPRLLDLFSDDVEFYYPRFGIGRGKAEFAAFAAGLRTRLDELRHRKDDLRVSVSGDHAVVEGTTEGRIADVRWSGGDTPGGRFCTVFDTAGGLITRMYIYLDPDYTSEHDLGFGWPVDRTARW